MFFHQRNNSSPGTLPGSTLNIYRVNLFIKTCKASRLITNRKYTVGLDKGTPGHRIRSHLPVEIPVFLQLLLYKVVDGCFRDNGSRVGYYITDRLGFITG